MIIRYTVTHWYSFLPIFNCFDYICGLTGAADPASGDGFFLITKAKWQELQMGGAAAPEPAGEDAPWDEE